MAAAQCENERFGGHHAGADLARERLDSEPDYAGIHVAGGDGIEQRLVVLTRKCDLDRGVGTMEGPERLGEPVVNRPRDADPQPSVENAAQGGDRVAASLRCRERCPGVRQQRLARLGESGPAPIAMKERLSELALQVADLGADRRLGH
jgi:hypothetical protein